MLARPDAAPGRRLMHELVAPAPDIVVVTPHYPGLFDDDGAYVRHRVAAYEARGLTCLVIQFDSHTPDVIVDDSHPSPVVRIDPAHAGHVIGDLAAAAPRVLVHSPTPGILDELLRRVDPDNLMLWFHGDELTDVRRLYFRWDSAEYALRRADLIREYEKRREAGRTVLPMAGLRKIFTSRAVLADAEFDAGVRAANTEVIHAGIDTDHLVPRLRTADDARSILVRGSGQAWDDGLDIAVDAIRLMSRSPRFRDVQVTICGGGEQARGYEQALQGHPNVAIGADDPGRAGSAACYYDHGILLHPRRVDPEALELGEAMAAGMACVVSDAPGAREYVDDSCGVLVPPDSPRHLAAALWRLIDDPGALGSLSARAAARVRSERDLARALRREWSVIAGVGGRDR